MHNIKVVDLRVRLAEQLRAEFKSLCATERTNMNDAVVELIQQWVENHKQKPLMPKGVEPNELQPHHGAED